MQLKVINSNSNGNGYILENQVEALIIECGVPFNKIKQAINYRLDKVAAAIVTHEHGDHSKSVKDALAAGIDVYATAGTFNAIGFLSHHRARVIKSHNFFQVGGFTVMPFDIKHDCNEPVGFLIMHEDCGTVLFLTDSYYTQYVFEGLNNIIVECNYAQDIIESKMQDGSLNERLGSRIFKSHMHLGTCKDLLLANDLSEVNNIVLIHLSDKNSDEARFKREVETVTGKTVTIASAGLIMDFNKTPY